MKCPCGHDDPCVRFTVKHGRPLSLGEVQVFNLSPEVREALMRHQGRANVVLSPDVLASVRVVPWPSRT